MTTTFARGRWWILGLAVGALLMLRVGTVQRDSQAKDAPVKRSSSAEPMPKNAAQALKRGPAEPFAIVELFTSEGCSSCPPADANLQRISQLESAAAERVVPLSFHVDYWNGLGWKDEFSQRAFSQRQSQYSQAFGNQGNVYTPQMIVNGRYEMNGSDQRTSHEFIAQALKEEAQYRVSVRWAAGPSRTRSETRTDIEVQVDPASASTTLDGGISGQELVIVTARDTETTKVLRGENGGRQLKHVWLVISLQQRPLQLGVSTIQIPTKDLLPSRSRIVAFVQSKSTRAITGTGLLNY